MSTTTTTQVGYQVSGYYDRALLERAKHYLAHELFGQERPLPKNSTNVIKFRRYANLTASTAPLSEGVTPSAQQLSATDLDATVYQYGAYVQLSDWLEMTNPDPVVTEAVELIGDNAGESIDCIRRDVLAAGTSVFRAGSVARSSITTKLTAAELDKIERALKNNKAKPWVTNPIAGTTAVGTTPIPAAFFGICDPNTTYDLEAVLTTSWIPVHKYPNPKLALPNEVGSYGMFRFIETTNAKVFPDAGGTAVTNTLKYTTANSACDVHTILFFGQNAYGIVPLKGEALKTIIKQRGSGGTEDPLNQRSTVGWIAATTTKILNDDFMYRYEFGVSA